MIERLKNASGIKLSVVLAMSLMLFFFLANFATAKAQGGDQSLDGQRKHTDGTVGMDSRTNRSRSSDIQSGERDVGPGPKRKRHPENYLS